MRQSQVGHNPRISVAELVIEAKARKSLSLQELTNETNLSLAFVTAALLGQYPLPADAAQIIGERLDFSGEQ